jgi:hypothetical protein
MSLLQSQLNSIALDQLYVAFYPPDAKYMSLFTNGMDRAVDDERGSKRRRDLWERIRDGLLADLKDGEYSKDEERKLQFANAKTWINLEVAREALLSMSLDTYPNVPSQLAGSSQVVGQKQVKVKKLKSSQEIKADRSEISGTTESDDRFVFSKEVDGMFHESTTGDDYEEKLEMENRKDTNKESDDDSDASSSTYDSTEDDADPLKGFAEPKKHPSGGKNAKAGKENTSSSSSASSDSSDSFDSESEETPYEAHGNRITGNSRGSNRTNKPIANADDDGSDEEEEDDFFTTEKVPTEQVFAQAEKHQNHRRSNEDHYQHKKRSDKSKGFFTQNQTKREFRNFQHRKKRSKFS